MKFCTNCGKEVKENLKFCTNCGAANSDEEILLNIESQNIKEEIIDEKKEKIIHEPVGIKNNNKQIQKKLSRKQKIAILVIGIIFIVGFAGYKIGERLTSKETVIEQFGEALATRNTDKMMKYVSSADPNLKITPENLQITLNYLDEKPSYTQEILESLKEQALNLDNNLNSKKNENSIWDEFINENEEISIFTLKKQGKKLNIFNNYVIEIRPVYIELSSKLEGTELYVGEKLVYTSNSENFSREFGPYMPGNYEIKAIYKGEYSNLEEVEEVDLFNAAYSREILSVYLDLDARYIRLDTQVGYEDAKLFVNDIDTNILVEDAKDFGPINEGTKIYAVKNRNGKEIKSEEFIFNGGYYILLEFPKDIYQGSIYSYQEPVIYQNPIFNTITASSRLVEENYYHQAENAADNNKNTAWVEGNAGEGIGEWIKFESDVEQTVNSFSIINGYAKDNDFYKTNNRVAKFLVEYSDGTSEIIDLEDMTLSKQEIKLDNTKKTKYVKFTIMEVYNGSKYDDTCISEININ